MTPEEAKAYVANRKLELEQGGKYTLNPLNFVNLMIKELWALFQFNVCIDNTKTPIEAVFVNPEDGFVHYIIPEDVFERQFMAA